MYLWFKALHVIAIISWMAGLLYLPRLFVYHCSATEGSIQSETFKVMERRLLYAIMMPSMFIAWASGLFLAFEAGYFQMTWFHLKLFGVVSMTMLNFYLMRCNYLFQTDTNRSSSTFYRLLNEIPTLLMVIIVCLVILKP